MAIDMFLKLGDIEGESQDSKHKDEIEVVSYSFGASNFTNRVAAASGGGAGKVSLQDFHFVMRTNKASPTLFLSCASGKHIDSAVLSVRKAGAQSDYLKFTFSDVLISSYQTGASSADTPLDQISLNFAKLESDYTPQDPTGALLEPVTSVWDVAANKSA